MSQVTLVEKDKDQTIGKSFGNWTVEELKALSIDESMALFKTLDAPDFTAMNGEYEGEFLDSGSIIMNCFWSVVIYNIFIGNWLGKAFIPSDNGCSSGYNLFRKTTRIARKYRMETSIVDSYFDGRKALQLYYPKFRNICGYMGMIDEIRKINDNLYLGMGRITWPSTPIPFYLSGPVNKVQQADSTEQ